jgi:DNA-binding beta-propeller fold protein YncE
MTCSPPHWQFGISPATRKTVMRVPVGAAPIAVSFAAGSGWVSNTGAATVTRFDAQTGKVLATIPISGVSTGPLLATAHAPRRRTEEPAGYSPAG